MPQFPHSKYSASPASGVLIRQQGSHSPMVEAHGYDEDPGDNDHPFKIKFVKRAGGWMYYVVPGTVNSKMPTLQALGKLDNNPRPESAVPTNAQNIYIECPYVEEEDFPKDPVVQADTSTPEDTDEVAHIMIGSIGMVSGKPEKFSQVVETSLSMERLKCGDADAEYLISRA